MQYAKIMSRHFMKGEAFEQILSRFGAEAVVLAIYLKCSHHGHYTGVYPISLEILLGTLHTTKELIRISLDHLKEVGFCKFDFDREIVFVVEMCQDEAYGLINRKDKKVIGAYRHLSRLPDTFLKQDFVLRYGLECTTTTAGSFAEFISNPKLKIPICRSEIIDQRSEIIDQCIEGVPKGHRRGLSNSGGNPSNSGVSS